MKKFISIFLVVICCRGGQLIAQADSAIRNVSIKTGLYYNTKLNYYGRTDSLQSSGLFPLVEIWFKEKFYINAAPVFTHSRQNGFAYAGSVANLGFMQTGKHSAVQIYLSKPFYRENTSLVQSVLKLQAAASVTWKNDIVNLTGGADLKVSDGFDPGVSAGLDHLFRYQLPSNVVLVVNPTAYVYAGTQNFSTTNYDKPALPLVPPVAQTKMSKQLCLLSYEFTLPVMLGWSKYVMMAIPAYTIPKNVVDVENTASRDDVNPVFFMTVGMRVGF